MRRTKDKNELHKNTKEYDNQDGDEGYADEQQEATKTQLDRSIQRSGGGSGCSQGRTGKGEEVWSVEPRRAGGGAKSVGSLTRT